MNCEGLIQWHRQGGVVMSDLFWLSKAQMRRIEPYFPLSHGIPRVDDRRVVSGITRYDRCAHTFFSAICIAAIVIFWINQ
jgi:hypothetical protein